ncbi:MAG: YodL domain-containing protein, partial [Oscillospiraceae bacterium]
SIALEETADRILISLERESSRSEIVPEVIEEIDEIKDIDDTDNIKEALDLDNNTITFSVIRIDGGEPIVTGDYIDQYGITDLDEYKDYIYDSGKGVGSITEVEVSYYMTGGGDNESYAADDDERDYISEHLEEVLSHRFTDLLEADTYSVRTPDELIEQYSSELDISQKNLLFTVAEFEDGSKYVLPGKVDDNNIKDTEAWQEVKKNNFDVNNIGELEEDIKVRLEVYQTTGSGEASVPSQEELRELESSIDDILFSASQISFEEAYIRPWTDVDDILYNLENVWKERHANEPNVSDGFDNSSFLYPKNLMRIAHDSNGKDHYNLDDAIIQIKLAGSPWLHPVDAAVEMNRRGVNINDIEMLNVRYVSSDGTVGEKDLTPEQYIVYRAHNEERPTAFLAAVESAENRTKIPEEMMNIIYNDMPSFVKSSVAWDELMEYDGISERLEKGEDPVEVAKSYVANNGRFSWASEELKDGYFTWSAKDKGDTAEIFVDVIDNDTYREKYKSSFEVSWNDIADAFKKRIEQELNYNKLYDKTITVAAVGDDKYRFIDKEKNVDVIKNRAELEELFTELFNKEELGGIIRQLIDNAPFEEYSAPENRIPDDMVVIDDKDNAVTMWEMGIKVYRNNEPVAAHESFGDAEGIYTAAKADVEIFNTADTIASAVWDMNAEFNSVPNEAGQPYYLSLEKNYDEWANYEKGLNEYENTLNALFGGNADTVAEYLENVMESEDVSAELREKAEGMLDEVKHFKELSGIPEKNNDIARFSIYQIPSGERYRDIRYESMEHLSIMGQLPDRLNYEKVYEGQLDDISGDNKLEEIFKKFNIDHPKDYTGRSLSTSDVVVIEDENGKSAHYVDDIGYKDISDIFLETERKEQAAEKVNIYDFQNIRLVSRSEWFDYTLGDDENPAFEEKNESYTPQEDGSFNKYSYVTANSNLVDVSEEESSVSAEDMLAEIENHLNKMGRENSRVEYHIELTDPDGNMRRLDSGNFEFYSDKSSFDLDRAKKYIENFLDSEYSSKADFSDMEHVSIGYTEIGSEEQGDHSLQMEADLVNYSVNYFIDDELAKTEKYDSLEQMNRDHLSVLNFEDMLHVGTTELDRILEEKPVPEVAEKRKSGSEVEVGDRFLYNDREYTVTSEKGVYPDDVGVSYEENAGGRPYVITQNIDRNKLADNGIFLGNNEKELADNGISLGNHEKENREAEKEKSSEESKSELTSEQREDFVRKNNTLNNFFNNNPKEIFREIVASAGLEPTEDITVEETKEMFNALKSADISLMDYNYTLEFEPNEDTLTVKDTDSNREADFVWGQVKELMYLAANEKSTSRENSPEPTKDKTEYTPKIGDLIDINDELLIISDINSSIITFTETENLFGNTSRMSMADFLASDFTVVEENESEIAEP